MHYIQINYIDGNGKTEKHYICIEHITKIEEDISQGIDRTIVFTVDGKYFINGLVASELVKIATRATEGKVIQFATKG